MRKKLLAGLLSLMLLTGYIQPVLATEDVTVSENENAGEDADVIEEVIYEEDEVSEEVTTAEEVVCPKEYVPATEEASKENVRKITYAYVIADPIAIDEKNYDLIAYITYYRVVKYSGKKIKAGTDLFAQVTSQELDTLAKDLSGATDVSGLVKWKFSAKKNKKCSDKAYFIVKGTVQRSVAKSIGLKGKKLKKFKKALGKINKAAKKMKLRFTITAELEKEAEEEIFEAGPVKIDAKHFPDEAFRKVVSQYDTNKNGTLETDEIKYVINIHCEEMNVKSIKGVEYFFALQGLWCMDNQITSIDLSHNRYVTGVWCSGNQLTELDFTDNPELLWVYCHDNKIRSLNVSNNPKLAFIECNTNPMPILDVSHNPELEHLMCGSCELKELNLGNCPKLAHLDAFRNKLTSLDVTKCPKMKRLDIWDNPGLKSIDISKNPELQYYNCAANGADNVDVSHNPELLKLVCSYNQEIKTLDLSHNPKLSVLDCASNQIASLDISKNPYLYFLQAFTNEFTTLDISKNPFLVKTYKEGKKEDESAVCKGHSWTIDYGWDDSTQGDNKFFLCFDDKVALNAEGDPSILPEDGPYKYSDQGIDETDLLKREEVMQKLYELAGKPDVSGLTSRFTDVAGSGYEAALLWGEAKHICAGFPYVCSDKFGVGEWITRQDLMLMLMRYSEAMNLKRAIDFGRSDDYIDYFDVDYFHWEAVCWSATWQIMEGKGAEGAPKTQQKIDPFGRVSKSDLEKVLQRMDEVNR